MTETEKLQNDLLSKSAEFLSAGNEELAELLKDAAVAIADLENELKEIRILKTRTCEEILNAVDKLFLQKK